MCVCVREREGERERDSNGVSWMNLHGVHHRPEVMGARNIFPRAVHL